MFYEHLSLFTILITCLLSIWFYKRSGFISMYWNIKGPIGLPIVGVGLETNNSTNICDFLTRKAKDFGNCFFAFMGSDPFLITTDPAIVEEIFTSDNFIDKMDIYSPIKDTLGDGLFTLPGEKWTYNRKIINKAFTHKILLSFISVFNEKVNTFNQVIEKYVDKDGFDMFEYIEKCTIDTAFTTTLGQKTNLLLQEDTDIFHIVVELHHVCAVRIFNPFLRNSYLFCLTKMNSDFTRTLKHLFALVEKLVTNKINCINKSKVDDDFQNNNNKNSDSMNITKNNNIFIDQVVKSYQNGEFTYLDVTCEIPTMLLAAVETTATTLYTTLLLLAVHKKYQDLVYNEIQLICPKEEDNEITYEHVRQMPYTEMCINESMRLIATVPLVGRKALKDYNLKKEGIFIAKGTNIVINIFDMHRDENIWGPKAKEFNPDNFLKENISKQNPYSFVPFTKGIRNCIGWRYGMLSVQVMLANILRKYEVSTKWKLSDLQISEYIVTKIINRPNIEIKLRNPKGQHSQVKI